MARIDGIPESEAKGMLRIVNWMMRRRLGKTTEPTSIMAHHPWVLRGYLGFEYGLDRSRQLDAKLKELASIKAATLVGCPF